MARLGPEIVGADSVRDALGAWVILRRFGMLGDILFRPLGRVTFSNDRK